MEKKLNEQITAMAVDKYPSPEYDDDSIELGKQEAYTKGASEALEAVDWDMNKVQSALIKWNRRQMSNAELKEYLKQNIILNPKNI